MTRDDLLHALQSSNVVAFERVIRSGETNQTEDAYRMFYGGTYFDSFDDHPRKRFSLPNGKTTTAAGAYQAQAGTWDDFCHACGRVPFTPINQDLFAVWCIARRHALDDVIAGRLDAAIAKLPLEWASLALPKVKAKASAVFAQYGGQAAILLAKGAA